MLLLDSNQAQETAAAVANEAAKQKVHSMLIVLHTDIADCTDADMSL
jgi:hypothetical protein